MELGITKSHTMLQAVEFVKAFILINVVWTSDKICLFITDFLALSNLHNFLLEFQIIVNILISLSIGTLTVIKIFKVLKGKKESRGDGGINKEEKSDEEN